MESLVKQMKQAAEFAENLVQKSSSSDVMQNKETLKQKSEELRGVEVPKHQQKTFLQFSVALRLVETGCYCGQLDSRCEAIKI